MLRREDDRHHGAAGPLAALVVVVLALGVWHGPARAWDIARTSAGIPVRWFERDEPLPFSLGAVPPEELSVEVVTAIVEIAWRTWSDAADAAECPGVATVVYRGATDATLPTRPRSFFEPPDNLVLFVRTASAWSELGRGTSEIAVTFVSNNERTGEIVDADIVVNDARWRFTLSDVAATGEVDFISTMTHEVGHALGLLHSLEPDATMFATYTGVEPAGARTLSDDDRAGLCATYLGVPAHVPGELVEHCVGTPAALVAMLWLALRRRRAGSERGRALSSPR